MKKQSGVSLIALVITIIVLLILGGVIINMLLEKNENIMTNAKNAVDKYNDKVETEKEALNTIQDYFEQYQ